MWVNVLIDCLLRLGGNGDQLWCRNYPNYTSAFVRNEKTRAFVMEMFRGHNRNCLRILPEYLFSTSNSVLCGEERVEFLH